MSASCGLKITTRCHSVFSFLSPDNLSFQLSVVATLVTAFMILFPRVMISSLNPAWSLTIYTASSSPYTLQIMTVVALLFVPVVLAYQGWTYWVFRKRVTTKAETLTY